MAVKIRLSRLGTKHVPYYRIVAIDSKSKRDGACLENLGTYDALKSKLVTIHPERIDAWLEKGAILSDSAKKIYKLYKKTSRL